MYGRRPGLLGDPVQFGAVVKVFIDAQVRVYRWLLRQVANLRFGQARLIEQVDTVDGDASATRREIAADHLHGGGFACAVGTQKAQNLALGQLETDRVDGKVVPVVAIQLVHADKGFGIHMSFMIKSCLCVDTQTPLKHN